MSHNQDNWAASNEVSQVPSPSSHLKKGFKALGKEIFQK